MNIYTITLNPAYDVHAYLEQFAPYHENLAQILSRQAGGKGVNLSRALKSGGVESTAVIVLGRDNAEEFKAEVKQAGLRTVYLEKPGRIRENLTLHSPEKPETRISFSGFPVEDGVLGEIADLLDIGDDMVVTFTGRVASGMSMEKVKGFLKALAARGVRIVLDSKSFSLADVCEIKPWLIKPNQEEIAQYLGGPVKTLADAREKARVFSDNGVTHVMVSQGEQGALLLSGGQGYLATPPTVRAVSTIGAGDSTLAGFLAAAQAGRDAAGCLQNAVAYGTAACLTEGSLPPRWEDIAAILPQVRVEQF